MENKIRIVTLYYKNYNYGGQLQAFAMQRLFADKGLDVYLITFKPDPLKDIIRKVNDIGIKGSFNRFFNKLQFKRQIISDKENHALYMQRIVKFNKFMDNIPHTELYKEDEIHKCNSQFDMFVCGSDQVWNPRWWNKVLLLEFTDKFKYAYAVSISRSKLTFFQKQRLIKATKNFVGISVRELQSKEMLQEFMEKEIYCTLDPTFMIDQSVWDEMEKNPQINDEYILIYNLGNITDLFFNICNYASQKGYKIFLIGKDDSLHNNTLLRSVCTLIVDAGPEEWLGWIKNARFVFTDSFHGTVFSILFHRDFWCYEKVKEKKNNGNVRLYNLLQNLELDKRFLKEIDDNTFTTGIDYHEVEMKIFELKKLSMSFIDMCLKNGRI